MSIDFLPRRPACARQLGQGRIVGQRTAALQTTPGSKWAGATESRLHPSRHHGQRINALSPLLSITLAKARGPVK